MRVAVLVCLLSCAAPLVAQAQAPAAGAPAPASATTPAPAAVPALQPIAVDNYIYQAEGRRDPFLSLTSNVSDTKAPLRPADGIAGLTVTDLSVRGVMKSRGSLIAMVQGPDKRAFVVHPGDKFADGTVKAVTPDGLVIVQQVNDPLSLVKQREVRKMLRSVEDGKQ